MTIKEKDSNHMSKIKLMAAVDSLILNDGCLNVHKHCAKFVCKQELQEVSNKFEQYV